LKRICVALSILCLFITSIFGHPNCCFSEARDYPAKPSSTTTTDCCGQKESPQPTSHCNNAGQSGCHAQKSVRKCSDTTGAEDYGNKKDCKTICYRLLPPLLADGPSRSTLPNSDNMISDIMTHQIILSSVAYAKAADDNPPWDIHPSIATAVLRI
jgi:hypothetical protein